MPSFVDALFVVVVLAGLTFAGLGYVIFRRWTQLGAPSLAAFAVVLGLGSAASGLLGVVVGPGADELGMPAWGQLAIFVWALSSVPWLVFCLQYTGRYTQIGWSLVALVYAPFLGFGIGVAHSVADLGSAGIVNAVSSVVFVYCFALAFLGVFLLVQASYSYIHLSLKQGVALGATPIIVVIAANSIGALQDAPVTLIVGQYTVALAVSVGTFGFAVLRNPVLEWTPAVETLGNRAIMRETDDLIFVVDEQDTIVERNTTAKETLRESPLRGRPLRTVLDHDSADLETVETLSLDTTAGKRRYDPGVSPIVDDRGGELGAVLSLRDVTERELREQRLAVLNRVLRHNLRNKVDVVKSHAEILDQAGGDEHVHEIITAADEITELGYRARRVDRFVSESTEAAEIDLVSTIETLLAELETTDESVSVTLDLPEHITVRTNRQALESALESALDNAVAYADSTVEIALTTGESVTTIEITDDGPGIPEQEIESIDAGTETPLQHGTGLGLWQLTWAVTTMGGDLSFETENGTTVRFTVPDRPNRNG